MRPRAPATTAVVLFLVPLAAGVLVPGALATLAVAGVAPRAPRPGATVVTRPAPAGTESGTVVRVVDGDTLVVQMSGHPEKVRLIGVDTPESVDPRRPVEAYGREAAAFTRRLADGKPVVLKPEAGTGDRDRYGRLLRYVFLPDGTLLNAEIIRQGFGHAYIKFPFARMEEFRALERSARDRRIGLWAGGAASAARPPAARPASAIPGPAAPATRVAADGAPASRIFYVGSVQGRVYHRPSCEWAARIAPENRLTFRSAEEAAEDGYVPCRVCRPEKATAPAGPSR